MLKIDIEMRPSRLFLSLGAVLVILSEIIVFTLPILLAAKWLISLLIVAYSAHVLAEHGFFLYKNAIVGVRRSKEAGWVVEDKLGFSTAELCGSSTITRAICILNFKVGEKQRSRTCIVFKDSVREKQYRRLLLSL